MPDGMGLIANHAGGIFEHLSGLMGYETLCLGLYDQPELVRAVADRVGGLMEGFYRRILQIPRLIAVFPGDDMGFRTGTLIGPDHLRRYTLGWHRKFAEMTHAAGLPYFLHSCGNLAGIMGDLIDDVGIDGKHSFEDVIMPVEEVYRRWGGRTAILGGVDMDLLVSGSEEEVRARTRQILETCGVAGTGYCLGTGNTAANYVPLPNYRAMLDEGRRWNRERFGS